KPRWPLDPNAGRDRELEARVRALAAPKLAVALATPEKQERAGAVSRVFDEVWAALALDESKRDHARAAFEPIEAAEVRRLIVDKGLRLDGRKLNEIRPITIEVGYLPRAHGSTLFTRGETQALVSATLGTKSDEQKIETLEGETWRRFLLHYNFPSFSVAEVRRFGGPSRRDIGPGRPAGRALDAPPPAARPRRWCRRRSTRPRPASLSTPSRARRCGARCSTTALLRSGSARSGGAAGPPGGTSAPAARSCGGSRSRRAPRSTSRT